MQQYAVAEVLPPQVGGIEIDSRGREGAVLLTPGHVSVPGSTNVIRALYICDEWVTNLDDVCPACTWSTS
eukprot:COSAG06_NODE_7339_length_2540_cov_7.539533_2_plen_70_part_00